jgi:hypothetical protein
MLLSSQELDVMRWHNHGYYFDREGVLQGSQARFVPIPENYTQPTIIPRSAILHSNAAPNGTWWQSLINFWKRSDITGEAHFQFAWNGDAIQAMSIFRRADCNYKANRFLIGDRYYGAISFETEDRGAATLDQTGWTLEQLHTMIATLTALVIQHDVHCTAPAYWNSSGIGHHILHQEWSLYKGKTCPGATRIAQMDYIRRDVQERTAFILGELNRSCRPQ